MEKLFYEKKHTITLIFIISITLGLQLNAQNVIKFKSTDIAFKKISENGEWKDWTEWEETKVLIVYESEKERIKIYSKETQIFDIAEDEGVKINDNKEKIYSFFCVDRNGAQCRLKLWKRYFKSGNTYYQLYIHYNDYQYVYNIDVID